MPHKICTGHINVSKVYLKRISKLRNVRKFLYNLFNIFTNFSKMSNIYYNFLQTFLKFFNKSPLILIYEFIILD